MKNIAIYCLPKRTHSLTHKSSIQQQQKNMCKTQEQKKHKWDETEGKRERKRGKRMLCCNNERYNECVSVCVCMCVNLDDVHVCQHISGAELMLFHFKFTRDRYTHIQFPFTIVLHDMWHYSYCCTLSSLQCIWIEESCSITTLYWIKWNSVCNWIGFYSPDDA